MALIKLLVAPIRCVVNFPLFQLTVAIAVIVLLQAADSRSVFGKIFSALDLLVDLTVKMCAAMFEVKSFARSWLTTGFMIAYVYIAGLVIISLAKAAIRAAVEVVARSNAFGLRNSIARERGIEAYRAWLPLVAPEWQQDIDEWRSGEPDHPSRSDAIRIMIAIHSLRAGSRHGMSYRSRPCCRLRSIAVAQRRGFATPF